MSTFEIDDPVLFDTFQADERGRVTLGESVAGERVKVCVVEVVDEEED